MRRVEMNIKSNCLFPYWICCISLFGFLFNGCTDPEDIVIDFPSDDRPLASETILDIFSNNYIQMPEEAITINPDSSVWAQYALPTDRYAHGILGDRIEAGALVVAANGQIIDVILDQTYVYEDVRPRLYDVDGDDIPEVITIRTHVDLGAGIIIYKIENNALVEYAQVKEIGLRNRWLNIVSINDLDNDGIIELSWIETPHIGGTLKVAKMSMGDIEPLAEASEYSNHAIGEINLCLSALTDSPTGRVIYVPNQDRSNIVGFTFESGRLTEVDRIVRQVDFELPLIIQHPFENAVEDVVNCIF